MARLLTQNDQAAAQEVAGLAYELVQDTYLNGLIVPEHLRTTEIIGISPVCAELSDAATRAARQLGIVASREYRNTHCLTSFGSLEELPTEDDLILCLTWGQFNVRAFLDYPHAYFGRRKDIVERVGARYSDAYRSQSILYRQVTHTPPLNYPVPVHREHYWLKTTPEDIRTGAYPVGQVAMSDFSPDEWI